VSHTTLNVNYGAVNIARSLQNWVSKMPLFQGANFQRAALLECTVELYDFSFIALDQQLLAY
jgi:hypothetical protein